MVKKKKLRPGQTHRHTDTRNTTQPSLSGGCANNHCFHAVRCIRLLRQFHVAEQCRTVPLDRLPLRHRILEWLITTVSWYSFCWPWKDDRLSQPTWCYFNGRTGARTHDSNILSQPPWLLSQHQAGPSGIEQNWWMMVVIWQVYKVPFLILPLGVSQGNFK